MFSVYTSDWEIPIRIESLHAHCVEKRFHSNSHKTCISYQDECWNIALMKIIVLHDVWDAM